MPASDSPAVLVARFLKANGYTETLSVFLAESGVREEDVMGGGDGVTIEDVLEERRWFDFVSRFEKVRLDGDNVDGEEEKRIGWLEPAPRIPIRIETLPAPVGNILHVSLIRLLSSTTPTATTPTILLTRPPSRLHLFSPKSPHSLLPLPTPTPHDSAILCTSLLQNRYLLSTSMSGQLAISDLVAHRGVLVVRRDHRKFVVGLAVWEGREGAWVATAGWDGWIFVYWVGVGLAGGEPVLGEPVGSVHLPTNPLSILFIPSPIADNPPLLLASRTDSTLLAYYAISPSLTFLGVQPLTPSSVPATAFSPSFLALRPPDPPTPDGDQRTTTTTPHIVAITTSHVPYQKLIIVRLVIPSLPATPSPSADSLGRTVSPEGNDWESAILIHTTTNAPQTLYSTPQLAWRPGGKGVWVTGDDGVVRGVDVVSGRVVKALSGGHEEGTRVRALWAGLVDGEEVVISGGFDGRCVVWRCET
ncbi:hypothetical protein FGG08_007419 [Glutinoglossum americanum]|uniref:LisH domain-containing protein n=1 Tax=Glutinoglossum americanum TaxID=1670608 RepID=A0A9P8HWC6_9PEZI|nr:hypothetical protein FGG08_007419 [Glutinoglossum americanum]